MSLAFLHIPLPEFGYHRLSIRNGYRREPTESPSFNSCFYDALVKEGISALGCGHDHVNDFCALLPQQTQQDGVKTPQPGPWLGLFFRRKAFSPTNAGLGTRYEYRVLEDFEAGRICHG
jgi:hypothetical protein